MKATPNPHALWFACVVFALVCCDGQKAWLASLKDHQTVVLSLKHHGLDSIPEGIGELKNAKSLTISLDSTSRWVIYPPLSAMSTWHSNCRPKRTLPHTIARLPQLEKLVLSGLMLAALPAGFENLQNLKYLDLSMNGMELSKELPKLKKLKNLEKVLVYGNQFTPDSLSAWQKSNPKLSIVQQLAL